MSATYTERTDTTPHCSFIHGRCDHWYCTNEGTDGSFLMTLQDADGNVPFYWGVDSDGRLVVSDDGEIVKKACGKSSAPFPKGKRNDQQSNHHELHCPFLIPDARWQNQASSSRRPEG